MTRFVCQIEQLPDDAREYLRQMSARGGNRMPGMYVRRSDARPVWAFLLSPVIAGFALLFASMSNKDAWAIALLQTAGVVLGGWLLLYSFRRWFGPPHYVVFDPTHVYEVVGSTVTVTALDDCRGIAAAGSGILFDLGGRRVTVPVGGVVNAREVSEYYEAVDAVERHRDPFWRNLEPGETGGVAKHLMEYDEMPPDIGKLNLDVAEVPLSPRPVKSAGWAVGRYAVILGVGGVVYLGFLAVNDPLRDDRAFAEATAPGAGAGGLRGYLIDDRNTRHRDDATARLQRLYDPVVARLEAVAVVPVVPQPVGNQPALPQAGPVDPAVRAGMIAMVKKLRDSPQPVASIAVMETHPPEAAATAEGRQNRLRTDLADGIALTIGRDLVAFVGPPPNEPANITFATTLTPVPGADGYSVSWQLLVRPTLTDEPMKSPSVPMGKFYTAAQLDTLLIDDLKRDFFQTVFSTTPPNIPPPPITGGDWGD